MPSSCKNTVKKMTNGLHRTLKKTSFFARGRPLRERVGYTYDNGRFTDCKILGAKHRFTNES